MVTMSQKSSVPQAVKSVSQALMSDTQHNFPNGRNIGEPWNPSPGEGVLMAHEINWIEVRIFRAFNLV
jgi:hypothetical protein